MIFSPVSITNYFDKAHSFCKAQADMKEEISWSWARGFTYFSFCQSRKAAMKLRSQTDRK